MSRGERFNMKKLAMVFFLVVGMIGMGSAASPTINSKSVVQTAGSDFGTADNFASGYLVAEVSDPDGAGDIESGSIELYNGQQTGTYDIDLIDTTFGTSDEAKVYFKEFTTDDQTFWSASDSFDITVTIQDDDANTDIAEITGYNFVEVPTISNIHPADGSSFSTGESVDYSADVTHDEQLSSYAVYVNGSSVFTGSLSGTSDTVSESDTYNTFGMRFFEIRATDDNGDTVSSGISTFNVGDNEPPTSSNPSPSDGSLVSSSPQINLDVQDNNELESYVLYIDDSIADTGNIGGTSDTISYQTDLSDGQHSWYADVEDTSGNIHTTSEYSFTLDSIVPTIDNIDPQDGSTVNDPEPTITLDASDNEELSEIRYYQSGAEIYSETVSGTSATASTDLPFKPPGDATIDFEVEDAAGNVQTGSTTFTVDYDYIEDYTVSGNLDEGIYWNQGNWDSSITANSGAGIDYIQLVDNSGNLVIDENTGSPINYSYSSGTYEASESISSLYEGEVTWEVVDNDGDKFTQSFGAQIDSEDPTATKISPDSAYTTTDPLLDVGVNDNGDLSSAVMYLDGNQVESYNINGGSDRIDYQASGLSSGQHSFTAQVTDEAGNTGNTSWTFTVDANPPSIDSFYAAETQGGENRTIFDQQNVWFGGEFSDDQELDSIELYIDGQREYNLLSPSNPQTADTEITGLSEGTHTYKWSIEDATGKETNSSEIQFEIDLTKPAYDIDINKLNDTAVRASMGNFSEDIQSGSLDLIRDGTVVETKSFTSTGSYEILVTNASDGEYEADGSATDLAGNTLESGTAFGVLIDNSAPSLDSLNLTQTGINGDLGVYDAEIEASDNIGLEKVELEKNGEIIESSDLSGQSDSVSFSNIEAEEGDSFKAIVFDQENNTDSATETADPDLKEPEIDSYEVEILGTNETRAKWDSEFNVTVNATDENEIDEIQVQLVTSEKLTEWVYLLGNEGTVVPSEYFSEAELKTRSGPIYLNIDVVDEFGNARTYTGLETDLRLDTVIDFRNWRATSPTGEYRFDLSFESNDDLQTIDGEIFLNDQNPSLNFSTEGLKDCGVLQSCSGQYLDGYDTSYNITVENPTNTDQILNYRGSEIGTIPGNGEIELYSQAGNINESTEGIEKPIIEITGHVPWEDFKDRFTTKLLYGDLPTSQWNQEGEEGDWEYSTEETVPSEGSYNIELYLEDDFGNNLTVNRDARIRPDTMIGNFYQNFVNAGVSEFIAGLFVLFLVPALSLIAELKSFGSSILSQGITIIWSFGLVVGGFLPTGAWIVALFLGGFLTVKIIREFLMGSSS